MLDECPNLTAVHVVGYPEINIREFQKLAEYPVKTVYISRLRDFNSQFTNYMDLFHKMKSLKTILIKKSWGKEIQERLTAEGIQFGFERELRILSARNFTPQG